MSVNRAKGDIGGSLLIPNARHREFTYRKFVDRSLDEERVLPTNCQRIIVAEKCSKAGLTSAQGSMSS
jgi:hypothetical protein